MRRTDSVHVAVLTKAPLAGAVKTRLIPAIGAVDAARLHRKLVLQTVKTAAAADVGPVTVWGAPDVAHRFFRALVRRGLRCRPQPHGDLGHRMRHAFLAHAPSPTILIGTDCPVLTVDHLREAADIVRGRCDAVFLPAEDGGYALIGLGAPAAPPLFEDVPWSTTKVMAITRARLAALGYSWREPAVLWDVDRPEDLARWRGSPGESSLAGPIPLSRAIRVTAELEAAAASPSSR